MPRPGSATIPNARIHPGRHARPVDGELVLYWMQVTLRAEDNYALNFAVERANELGLPVLVYHGLRPDYPWASDRIHGFILESVMDLRAGFERRGIPYHFHLDRHDPESGPRPDGPSPLVALARRAAMVVTDFYPTFIVPRQTKRLREILDDRRTPVIAVDSATVVPMAALETPFSTARAIRPRLLEALSHYLHPVGNVAPKSRLRTDPGFEDIRPTPETLAGILESCPIDHTVAPAPGIRGGTRAARKRLTRFLAQGLPEYTEGRNDPNRDVTSGMSPYLHFGNISIQEVLLRAREAGPASQFEKFQDEALTWRELAHNFVYHDRRHRTVAAIPGWARKELDDHSGDPRPARYSARTLERAETGEALWDAAQRSYLREGTMHNYMRMLWGKTVLQWTPDYRKALRLLEHLNNKYSLDGRDPSSYGGIMWIFGKFDRPFYRRPIYGTVRYISLRAAEKKFDAGKYVEGFKD
ncbi:MAG: deoxyribodipyrimidine photo-lyase [Gemmatimonadales bacterium]